MGAATFASAVMLTTLVRPGHTRQPAGGRPAFAGIEPPAAVALAVAHLKSRVPPADWTYMRFFFRDGMPDREWERFHTAFLLHVNLISLYSEPVRPLLLATPEQEAAGKQGDLYVLDTRDPRWKLSTFEKLADIDPYYHVLTAEVKYEEVLEDQEWPGGVDPTDNKYYKPGTYKVKVKRRVTGDKLNAASFVLLSREETEEVLKARKDPAALTTALAATNIGKLLAMTKSQVPFVRADWFLVQGSRQLSLNNKQTGVGYYDWLRLKDRDDFFRLVKLREADSIEIGREIRAVITKSGVSQQNRQVERLQALAGGLYFTLDVKDPTGRGNAAVQLKKGDYLHDAEEIYGALPNGLPATFLSDAKGVRQDSAPDFIGGDDSPLRLGRDARIHVNIACIRCHHGNVLQPLDDYVRRNMNLPQELNTTDYDLRRDFLRQYFSNLNLALANDRLLYWQAVGRLTGVDVLNASRDELKEESDRVFNAYAGAYNAYVDTPLKIADVAREHHTTPVKLKGALLLVRQTTGALNPALAGLLTSPPDVTLRTSHEELYQLVETHLRGMVTPP
jgi:hypothetical protein